MIVHYHKNNKISRTVELLHGELYERRRGSADKAAAAASIFNSIEYCANSIVKYKVHLYVQISNEYVSLL